MHASPVALVLGATGGIGGEMARGLRRRGWHVRALHRRAAEMVGRDGLEWLQGDAMRADDVIRAAEGATLIVHAVNPPGYKRWNELVLPMLESSIAAARASGARIVLPGTVYNFAPDVPQPVDEDAPQRPVTRKGAIRAAMEARLREVAAQGVRSLIVRAGDFFGPQAGNTWFSQGLVQAGTPVKRVTVPNAPGVGHQWAYLPDVAETMLRLIEQGARLGAFEVFHMEGHWDPDGRAMTAAIERAVGRPVPVRAFPWWMLTLAAPFVTLFREMQEMRYLWKRPLRMSNRKLVAFLGAEPHTPLDAAVRAALAGIGCLEVPEGAAATG